MKKDVAGNKTIGLSHADKQGLTPPDDAQQVTRRVQTRIVKPVDGRQETRSAATRGRAATTTATGRQTLPISGRAAPNQPADRR